jgi:antitoxin VapB
MSSPQGAIPLRLRRKRRGGYALANVREQNWTLPADRKFDRDEANERSGRRSARECRVLNGLTELSLYGIYHWYLPNGGKCIMSATAKLFMHGRSQAVRLPKEFRFEGSEVRVSKVGNKVILEPLQKQPIDLDKFWAELDALGARDFLPDGIPDEPPAEPDPRVFFDE